MVRAGRTTQASGLPSTVTDSPILGEFCSSLWGGEHGCGLRLGHETLHKCANCDETWTDEEAAAWMDEVRRRISADEYDHIGDGVYRIKPLTGEGPDGHLDH